MVVRSPETCCGQTRARPCDHFRCSGTHQGEWLGAAPTGRRFENVDEIYVLRIKDGKLTSALGVEDNLSRMSQLGLWPP
jgi:predicted ester cyclase